MNGRLRVNYHRTPSNRGVEKHWLNHRCIDVFNIFRKIDVSWRLTSYSHRGGFRFSAACYIPSDESSIPFYSTSNGYKKLNFLKGFLWNDLLRFVHLCPLFTFLKDGNLKKIYWNVDIRTFLSRWSARPDTLPRLEGLIKKMGVLFTYAAIL